MTFGDKLTNVMLLLVWSVGSADFKIKLDGRENFQKLNSLRTTELDGVKIKISISSNIHFHSWPRCAHE